MNSTLVRVFIGGAIAVAAATMAHAQQSGLAAQNFDRGKYEYDAHCATCHGMSGKGDGPFALCVPKIRFCNIRGEGHREPSMT
jgi:mono/diheme cytochrome c family protein